MFFRTISFMYTNNITFFKGGQHSEFVIYCGDITVNIRTHYSYPV